MRRLSRFTGHALTTTVSRVGIRGAKSYFPSPVAQSGLIQNRRFYSRMPRANFKPAVYNFLCIYNKCKDEPTYREFLKQNKIDSLDLPDYSIKDNMVVAESSSSVVKLQDMACNLLHQNRAFIEQHQESYEKYFKQVFDRLQTETKVVQEREGLIPERLQERWKQASAGGRTFMSACLVAEAEGSKVARVSSKADHAPGLQQEREKMSQMMKAMDMFMQNCVVLKTPGAQGIVLPNEETHPSVKAALGDFFEASGNAGQPGGQSTILKKAEIELESTTPPKHGIIITGSSVTITQNYYGTIFEKYAIFLILASTCGALLYWYLKYSRTKCIANNVSAPYEYYQESHWSEELEQKVEALSASTESGYPVRIAITGTPGSGKTDLAKYYAHKHASGSSIVWSIVADTPENLWRNYRLLADELKIGNTDKLPGEDDQGWHERICHRVNKVLSEHPGWILIFDNVKQLADLNKFLPPPGEQKGTILITSRDAYLIDRGHSISISGGLTIAEAIKLLQKITKLSSEAGAEALAISLDRLPLYLLIAATTIRNARERNPEKPITYASYGAHIHELSTEDIEAEHSLNIGQLDDTKTQHAVIRDAIGKLGHEAQALLVFCSYISSTGISRKLLENFIRVQNGKLSDDEVSLRCDTVLLEIQKSSLLQQLSDQSLYNIHRITQQIGRKNSISETQANKMLSAILLPLEGIGDDMKSNSAMEVWKPILPHMVVLASHREILRITHQTQTIKFLQYIGKLQNILGNCHQALECFKQALAIGIKHYGGADHYEVALTLSNMGATYNDLGKAEVARDLLEQARPILEKYYGTEHYEVAKNLNDLGTAYFRLDELDEARKLYEQALPILEKHRGTQNYEVAKTLHHLGNVYALLRKVEKARELLERALDIQIKHYRAEHYEVAKTLNSLGATYNDMGKTAEAKKFYERALPILEKQYGAEHHEVARTLNNIGLAESELGNRDKAIYLLEKGLLIQIKYYGAENYEVALTLNNLGSVYAGSGNLVKAKELLEQALSIFRKDYKEGQTQITFIMDSLANVYTDLENPKEAIELLEEALQIREKCYGKEHLGVATILESLAKAYTKDNNPQKSLKLLERASRIRETSGKAHS